MAENGLDELRKDLNFKKLQLNSIYEFSSALHSSSDVDDILRIFFSIVMGPMGISRAFFLDRSAGALRRKGFYLTPDEVQYLKRNAQKDVAPSTCMKVSDLNDGARPLRELLQAKKVYYLINISQNKKKKRYPWFGAEIQFPGVERGRSGVRLLSVAFRHDRPGQRAIP